MKLSVARAGSLNVRIVEDEARTGDPSALVVLCHGYGAPGSDLCGIAGELVACEPRLSSVRFVFPEAPLPLEDMPFGGRAWWHIDVGRFADAVASGTIEKLFDETPEGLPHARKLLRAALDELVQRAPSAPLVLGGFSQGAMLATDTALHLETAPAALAVFSGTLVSRGEWQALAKKRAGLRVLQTHGTHDPLLPYAAALELKGLMEQAGLKLRFHSFSGGHGIDAEAIELCATLVASVVGAGEW